MSLCKLPWVRHRNGNDVLYVEGLGLYVVKPMWKDSRMFQAFLGTTKTPHCGSRYQCKILVEKAIHRWEQEKA